MMMDNSMEFKIIWNFGLKSILLALCSMNKIMLTQSSKSSEFNDQQILVWMIVTLPFWPCPWTSRPPAGGRSCSPASCRARRTSAQCHKNTTWNWQWVLMTFTLIQGLTHQQILGRFEGEENDESVGINFDGYRVRWWWRCRPSTH